MKSIVCLFIWLVSLAGFGQNQAISIYPNQPLAGQAIEIRYNPDLSGSTINTGEPLFAGINILLQPSFEYKQFSVPLDQTGEFFSASLNLPDESMQLTVYVYSSSTGSLDWNALEADIYNEYGKPILDQYPAFSYRNIWFIYPFKHGEQLAKEKIQKEMEEVEGMRIQDPLGTGFSMAYGYILTGNTDQSTKEIKGLLETYPNHQLTFQSLMSFNYQYYAGKITDSVAAGQMNQELLGIVKRNLDLQLARTYMSSHGDDELSPQEVEQICRAWFLAEPLDAQPYFRLASRYSRDSIYPSKVIGLSKKGMELILDPRSRVFNDLQGTMTQRFLSDFAYFQARALKLLGRPEEALIAATASQSLLGSANKLLFLGDFWLEWGNYRKAEQVWTEALKMGEAQSKIKLEQVYSMHSKGETFEAYIDSLLGKRKDEESKTQKSSTSSAKELAPNFTVTTIDGKVLSSQDLMGKVVVLNFWSLGCGPCRAEMPELNKLVNSFKEKGVVFIAFTPDKKEHVKEFLSKKSFDYQIACEAHKVFGAYQAQVQPTHVVIDQEGKIYNRMTGGGKKNSELLAGILEILVR